MWGNINLLIIAARLLQFCFYRHKTVVCTTVILGVVLSLSFSFEVYLLSSFNVMDAAASIKLGLVYLSCFRVVVLAPGGNVKSCASMRWCQSVHLV